MDGFKIQIELENNEFRATIPNDSNYNIHNKLGASSNALQIKIDTTDRNAPAQRLPKPEVVNNAPLQTRFLYGEKGKKPFISEIKVVKGGKITSECTYVLRVVGTADYRHRMLGQREEPFDFIVENCLTSIHIEEDGKYYYLVVNNKS